MTAVVIADDTGENHHRARCMMNDQGFVLGGIDGPTGQRGPHHRGHRG